MHMVSLRFWLLSARASGIVHVELAVPLSRLSIKAHENGLLLFQLRLLPTHLPPLATLNSVHCEAASPTASPLNSRLQVRQVRGKVSISCRRTPARLPIVGAKGSHFAPRPALLRNTPQFKQSERRWAAQVLGSDDFVSGKQKDASKPGNPKCVMALPQPTLTTSGTSEKILP